MMATEARAEGSPGSAADARSLAEIEARIDVLIARPGDAGASARELLALAERVLERWIEARGAQPTLEEKEGFRLLALHRQGARGEPSFNACRETCRELAYRFNCVAAEPDPAERARQGMRAAMLAKHLCLFVAGKLQVAGLGEFCCAAKPLRANGN
jgi:hypothetical protein